MNNPCNLGMGQVPVGRLWEQRQPGHQSLVPGSAADAETCFFPGWPEVLGFSQALLMLMQRALVPPQQMLGRPREEEEGGSQGNGGQKSRQVPWREGPGFGRQPGSLPVGQGGQHRLMALFSLLNI